jgi:hypothetical protein
MNQTSLFSVATQTQCQITADGGLLVFVTPYKPDLVADLKSAIPSSDRRWDGTKKAWQVDPQYGKVLISLAQRYFGENIGLPSLKQTAKLPGMHILEVYYLGQCKPREDGSSSAFGYLSTGQWGAIFPEEALRSWFEAGPVLPGNALTLYGILGIKADCNPEELRSAFRRAARTWHPDVNKDPDAGDQFKKINHAYQVLSDLKMRSRYDAGLKLEASLGRNQNTQAQLNISSYRSPLNCGYIMVEGIDKLGRLIVEKILAWEDITKNGLTLCSSWPANAKQPSLKWA